ncbi:unnamed protein product [Effrenium voratum]|uniref:PPM-type phosphatase domain-containing protein n=1 Tax=Effrenium voratum TaxID=2562239 RepID=A0AA36IJB3_9DINO|nr:unnamed protein product [Effrenium voratum]
MIDGDGRTTQGEAAGAPATSSPNSARLSARSVSSLGSPCSASPLQPETGVPRLTGLAKWSSSRREGTSSLSAPRRRASGLARPPLENRWLQRVEACHERPASAASSTRGSSPGSSRGGRPEAIGLQKRRPPSSHREARGEFDTCDKLEEEVLSIMSVLQRPRDSTWAAAKTGVDSNGTALRTRSPAATTPRRSSPSPRDPHLRTAERAVARVEGPGPSLSERARQASSSSSASRTVRPKMSQKASQKLGASSSMTELGGGRLLRDSPLSQGRSARMEGLLRLSRAISEAQRALEVQTTEALRHPEETTSEESKALEAFAERLQRQLAEAQTTSRALEEIATARQAERAPQETWKPLLNGNHFEPLPIPEEAELDTDKAADELQAPPANDAASGAVAASAVEAEADVAASAEGGLAGSDAPIDQEVPDRAPSFSPKRSQAINGTGTQPPNGGTAGKGDIASSPRSDKANSDHLWEFVVQGAPLDESDTVRKTMTCFPGDAMAKLAENGVACVCARGHRVDPSVPNQDDLVLAMCSWGDEGKVALYGVFDGHGPAGHRCAALARGFLPERIFADPDLLSSPQEVLKVAFAEAQQEMLRQEPSDAFSSGCTATVCLVLQEGPGQKLEGKKSPPGISVHTAHVGDSRAIVAKVGDGPSGKCFIVKELTRDHRPDDEQEAQQVKDRGGHIRAGGKRARVICEAVPGHPGFALTRSLGLALGQNCGILAEPQITAHHLPADAEAILVLGTDGVFEFCGNRTIAGHLLKHGVTERALEEVVHESMKLWSVNSSNSTVDDATAIAASLGRLARAPRASSK